MIVDLSVTEIGIVLGGVCFEMDGCTCSLNTCSCGDKYLEHTKMALTSSVAAVMVLALVTAPAVGVAASLTVTGVIFSAAIGALAGWAIDVWVS